MSPLEKPPAAGSLALLYGKGSLALDLNGFRRYRIVAPPSRLAMSSPAVPAGDALVRAALAAPVASPGLRSLARGARTVVVAIPDATRPPVAGRLLPAVFAELADAGIEPRDITVFIAAGVHRTIPERAARQVAGEGVPPQTGIAQNDSRRPQDFRRVGTTRRGTPIEINRIVADADLRVVIGIVGFHYFAGMGGGRKMIVPGSCTAATVKANHALAIDDDGDIDPKCRSGVLAGNPVHEDMVEGMQMLGRIFMINAVLDGLGEVSDVVAGDAVESHLEAARRAKRLLEVPLDRRCDLAIASAGGHPLDVDLIQTHKSIDHAAASVRDGGALIAVAECPAGIGSDTFLDWFALGDAKAVCRRLKADYQLNGQTALSLLKKLERLRIILVSSLDRRQVESTGMAPAGSVGEAMILAARCVGEDPLIYVFPTAWGILPVVEEAR